MTTDTVLLLIIAAGVNDAIASLEQQKGQHRWALCHSILSLAFSVTGFLAATVLFFK